MRRRLVLLLFFAVMIAAIVVVGWLYRNRHANSESNTYIDRWIDDPSSRPDLNTDNSAPCPGAPFLLPSSGLVGLLWRDAAAPYNLLRRHTGIDIFGDGAPGEVPVVAAYDGYLTRLDDWFSAVIVRHDDPLQPGRTIWTYYTHMGNRDGTRSYISDQFPPGTSDVFVKQGTLLGYQGEYTGTSYGIAMHVHMSIVTSNSDGTFKNEAVLANTLDPSTYFGLPLNADDKPDRPVRCEE